MIKVLDSLKVEAKTTSKRDYKDYKNRPENLNEKKEDVTPTELVTTDVKSTIKALFDKKKVNEDLLKKNLLAKLDIHVIHYDWELDLWVFKRSNWKYFFWNALLHNVYKKEFAYADWFHEGLARVKISLATWSNKRYYLTPKWEYYKSREFEYCSNFVDWYAYVLHRNQYKFINKSLSEAFTNKSLDDKEIERFNHISHFKKIFKIKLKNWNVIWIDDENELWDYVNLHTKRLSANVESFSVIHVCVVSSSSWTSFVSIQSWSIGYLLKRIFFKQCIQFSHGVCVITPYSKQWTEKNKSYYLNLEWKDILWWYSFNEWAHSFDGEKAYAKDDWKLYMITKDENWNFSFTEC